MLPTNKPDLKNVNLLNFLRDPSIILNTEKKPIKRIIR